MATMIVLFAAIAFLFTYLSIRSLSKRARTFYGVVYFESETGEGIPAFQDERYISKDGKFHLLCLKCRLYANEIDPAISIVKQIERAHAWSKELKCSCIDETEHDFQPWFQDEQWSYEGLHALKDGDELTIYDPERSDHVVWKGIISFRQIMRLTKNTEGVWSHADQAGVPYETWLDFFLKKYPAKLVIARK